MDKYFLKTSQWSAITVSMLTIITFSIAFATPPLSGPYCVQNCLSYPYLDIISRFPRDYYWMYPATLLTLSFFILSVLIHHQTRESKKVFSQLGMFFAFFSCSVLVVDYFLQLTIIQASLLAGEKEGISLITQFNGHGIFIALEELAYIALSLVFLCWIPVFNHRILKIILILNPIIMTFGFLYYIFMFGLFREYSFEVFAITISWLTLFPVGLIIANMFKRGKYDEQRCI